jgi:hypothetical protein
MSGGGSRAVRTCPETVLALRWFRDRARIEQPGRDHAISRATAMAAGVPCVILDGKVSGSDHCSEPATSVKGEETGAWYSGKAHRRGIY